MKTTLVKISRWLCPIRSVVLAVILPLSIEAQEAIQGLLIHPGYHHLGDSEVPDWESVTVTPEGDSLEFDFQAMPDSSSSTLRIRHRDVDGVWLLSVNNIKIGELRRKKAEGDFYYEIPANVLVEGANHFKVVPEDAADDIAVGQIRLYRESLGTMLDLQQVSVRVKDAVAGGPLPARLSIVAAAGDRPEIYHLLPAVVAGREGLVYLNGEARFDMPRGDYVFSVTRGPEWSRAVETVALGSKPVELTFTLSREVDTGGYVAADTHIHTLTFSGHGDASTEERMISLAGEGVEFAVATDHNHNTDYRPYQEKLELTEFFTPVVGNEVTTDSGHINAFPLDPAGEIPNGEEGDWVKVVDDMRLKGAKVIILNHPRWPDRETGPFGLFGLNRGSGDRDNSAPFPFDAMELVNATTDAVDPLYLFEDWFSLLNRGERIVAVGVSDSHTLGDPVGQGRTYIKSGTDDPAHLDVDELCRNIVAGRSSVSLGIYVEIQVDNQSGSGDLVRIADNKFTVTLRVRAPGWIHPKKAMVFLNGVSMAEQEVPAVPGVATDARLTFQMPIYGVDAHLVCVVLGDPVLEAGWKTFNDYTLAATNPVYLDVNGDGKYSSPRDSAKRILGSLGRDKDALIGTLEIIDPVLGLQLISLVEPELTEGGRKTILSLLEFRAQQSDVFKRYLEHVGKKSE